MGTFLFDSNFFIMLKNKNELGACKLAADLGRQLGHTFLVPTTVVAECIGPKFAGITTWYQTVNLNDIPQGIETKHRLRVPFGPHADADWDIITLAYLATQGDIAPNT